MSRTNLIRAIQGSAIAALVALSLGSASAADQTAPVKTPVKKAVKAAPAKSAQARQKAATQGAPGMVVVKDPDTGQLRAPTAEEYQQLNLGAAQVTGKGTARAARPALEEEALPEGGARVRLDDSFASYSVVTKNADGTLSESCVTGDKAARSAVQKGVPARKENVDVK